jgi:hypothetical protein
MAVVQRLDPLEFYAASDEELPGYEPETTPAYEYEYYRVLPLHTYSLRQGDHRVMTWLPRGPSQLPSYKVVSNRSIRLFSKKPDMELSHASGDSVSTIRFDNDGPLPWRPRAHFSHMESRGTSTHGMESRNFTDWTVRIGEATFVWQFEGKPVSLALSEKGMSFVIARFTYVRGTLATAGTDVGEMVIYQHGISMNVQGIEKIIASVMIPIAHFKKMGRHYRNESSVGMV